MVILYVTVKKQENRVVKYTTQRFASATSQSRKIAYQCFAFTASFYIVYIPFVVGNWSGLADPGSDHQFTFLMFRSLLFPLQGFLNAFVYFRPRLAKNMTVVASRLSTYVSSRRLLSGSIHDSEDDSEDDLKIQIHKSSL